MKEYENDLVLTFQWEEDMDATIKHGCKDGNQMDFNNFNVLWRIKPKGTGVCYIFRIRVPILIMFSKDEWGIWSAKGYPYWHMFIAYIYVGGFYHKIYS